MLPRDLSRCWRKEPCDERPRVTEQFDEKAQELTRGLLKARAACFDYKFDEVYLKRGAYYPKYFSDLEQEQNTLRQQLLELLAGNRRLHGNRQPE
jgi:hypothetical protein